MLTRVRADVIRATNERQVPWDHSALTGDFFFHRAALTGSISKGAPAAPPDMQERLRKLEDELKKKADPKQTEDMVRLAQLRERVRQLDEANKADQRRMFDVMRESGTGNPAARQNATRETGKIQVQMVRRNQEAKKLREEIAQIEETLGVPPEKAAVK